MSLVVGESKERIIITDGAAHFETANLHKVDDASVSPHLGTTSIPPPSDLPHGLPTTPIR